MNTKEAIVYAIKQIGVELESTATRMGGDLIEWAHVFDTDTKNIVFSTGEHLEEN